MTIMAKAKSNKLEDLLMDIADFVDSNVYLRSGSLPNFV